MQFNNKMFVMVFCNFNSEIDYFYHNARRKIITRFVTYFFIFIFLIYYTSNFANLSFSNFHSPRKITLPDNLFLPLISILWKIRSLVCSFILTKSIRIPASCAKYHHFGILAARRCNAINSFLFSSGYGTHFSFY